MLINLVLIGDSRGAMGGGEEKQGVMRQWGGGEETVVLTRIVVIRLEPANTGSVVRMARALQASGLRSSAARAGAG